MHALTPRLGRRLARRVGNQRPKRAPRALAPRTGKLEQTRAACAAFMGEVISKYCCHSYSPRRVRQNSDHGFSIDDFDVQFNWIRRALRALDLLRFVGEQI